MTLNRFFVVSFSAFAFVLIAFGVGHGLMRYISIAPSQNTSTEFLFIESGDSVAVAAQKATSIGLVRTPSHFNLIVRWRGLDRLLFAGEYLVEPGANLYSILTKIEYQQTHKRRLVVPEGASAKEAEAILRASFGLDVSDFVLPEEGSILPETYFYERLETSSNVIQRMTQAQRIAFSDLWASRALDLPYQSMEEAVILASIVEKETGVASERGQVAAVFVNRLKKNMRLQSDPTVIYGITRGMPLGRPISRADLRKDTPYNTYRRSGLPPTPIANPGLASFEAAINPASVPYLYFVADGTGGHAFAETLEEHNKNVARWRQIQKGSR
ncbi:MAG: endolytic transglycosylase MltG [Kordiimonadaceae bacterium]|nr:endolytic transglycosylase MltG [Kordiimonadaceae bacterium]MBO6570169.1 endolytic transglycosylase MltG [Kordiimonadaceae bacterium]MBO6965733.1 endolytic transglycosylase MltG [Kordiimonadaceae bacterium]